MFRDTSATDTKLASGPGVFTRKHIVVGLVAAAVLVAGVYAVSPILSSEQSLSRERVRVGAVKRGTLIRDVSAQGRMVAARSPSLYTSAAGIVKFSVEPGAPVTSGTLLAEVDSPELQSQLKREESSLARVTAQLARQEIANRRALLEKQRSIDAANVAERAATRELERAVKAGGAIAEVELRRAQDEMQNAASTLKTAQADLALERDSLVLELRTYSEELSSQKLLVDELRRQVTALAVRAPFDGVVGNWLVTDRASVVINQPLLTVVDLTELEVEAAVPEVYAESLLPGQSAEITIGAERRRGSVHLVSPEVQNAQVLTRIRLTDGGSTALRQNQRVQVRVLLEEKPNVLLVDRGPTFERDASFAWVIEGDIARRTPITLGASSVTAYEVLAGLQPGQEVIVAGIDDLRGVDEVLLTR